MPELHPAQFADQQALPGMEHLAHPWARHLAQGYRLKYGEETRSMYASSTDTGGNQLQAHDMEDPHHRVDAVMTWAHKDPGDSHAPGEVHMITNYAKGSERGRGMARGLFESAHHFDFGQDTVPIHSPMRTQQGKAFSDTVRPDLKPNLHQDMQTMQVRDEKTGQPARLSSLHWDLPEGFQHPYQWQQEEQAKAALKRPSVDPRQGRLF